jgi:hypothetical protein
MTFSTETTVRDFLSNFSDRANELANDVLECLEFLRQRGEHKTVREEYVPIRAYLLGTQVPDDTPLILGGERQRFDAKIMHASGEEILEVTQATPVDEHKVRLAIAGSGMTDELRALEREQLSSFPTPIIEAINRKVAHGYPEPRTLLVAVIGEHTFEDDAIIRGWLPAIRQQSRQGNFRAVYLVETARSKLFKIY